MSCISYALVVSAFAAIVQVCPVIAQTGTAASSYFPLSIHAQWSYSGSYGLTRTIIDTARAHGHLFYGMASDRYPPSEWFRTSNDSVFVMQSLRDSGETLLYRLGADVGDTITLPSGYGCTYGNLVILAGKDDTVSTPSGTYFHCYHFRHIAFCMDAGMMDSWLAKDVGIVEYKEESIAGMRTFSLDSCHGVASSKELLQYYPLQTGDYWEYETRGEDYSTLSFYSQVFSEEVVGDTTMQNGYHYEILRTELLYPYYWSNIDFERVDSSKGCVYKLDYSGSREIKIDSLFAQPGDTIASSWKGITAELTLCDSITSDKVLGLSTQVRYAHNWIPPYGGGYVGVDYALAKGIGLFKQQEGGDFFSETTELVYAKINGKEYGAKINIHIFANELSYYPLKKGNYWEYKTDSYDCDMPMPGPCKYDTAAYSVEVVGDTLMTNDHSYKIMVSQGLYPTKAMVDFFERVDSSSGCVFRYDTSAAGGEYQIDSLFVTPGDTFLTIPKSPQRWWRVPFGATCLYDTSETILGTSTQAKHFREFPPVVDAPGEFNYVLAKGFGLYSFEVSWFQGNSTSTLVYAKINGVEYGKRIILDVSGHVITPTVFALFQNYPNPFNPATAISYQLPAIGHVNLRVYDVLGREVATLVDEKQTAGNHSVNFNASKLPSGVYFCRLTAGNFTATKKMVLLK